MRSEQRWWDGPWPWLTYLLFYGLPWLWQAPGRLEVLGSAAGVGLFLTVYLAAQNASGIRLLVSVAAISGIGLTLAPLGGGWTVFAFFAAMKAARLRPERRAVSVIVGVGVIYAAAGLLLRAPLFWWLPSLLTAMLMGAAALSREALYDRTRALIATQGEVRRLAGTAERERMARDLHDLIGRTLTLVALRADLAARLMKIDDAAARAEVQAIADAARGGLAEVRAALAGQASGGLAQEFSASTAALEAAGLQVEIAGDVAALPANVGALLAMTLREGVTNVIRHAGAARCRIGISTSGDTAELVIDDDGEAGPINEGVGLTGMRERLVAAGGALTIETDRPGTRLSARVPI